MLSLRTCLFIPLLAACMQAHGENVLTENAPLASVDKKMPALDLMPPGSVLRNVSLPRYVNYRISSLVTATRMIVISSDQIDSEEANVYLYNENRTLLSTLYMKSSSYFFSSSLVKSHGTTLVRDTRFSLDGTDASYDTVHKKGFVFGPVQTVIYSSTLQPSQ